MMIAQKLSARAKAILASAVIAAVLALSGPAFAQTPASAPQQGVTQVQDEVRGVLKQYGRFVQHEKYGEVWVPTVTPQGWHPYPPCNWINTRQYGWYYDDKTPWGQIVHHYGRWVHDAQMGWIWTPGAEFSPAWVIWRSSPQWVGWAPMLPDEDVQTIATADFNNAAFWTFVETEKFAKGCNGATVASAAQVPQLLTQTTYVTDIQLVDGITVFILPQYVAGPLVDINIVFSPWPTWFLAQTLIDWNFMWNNFVVVNAVIYQNCPPQMIQSQQKSGSKPQPGNSPQAPLPPRPVDSNPPVVIVTPPPVCPVGTVFNDGACRLADPCRGGSVRIGNACVQPVNADPLPKRPVRVTDNPCANLGAGEFQRCIRGTPPNQGVADGGPPAKGPTASAGDDKPVGNRPRPDGREVGPVGSSMGRVAPGGRNPGGSFHPNAPRPSGPDIRDSGSPSKRLPAASGMPMRPNPNPVVLGPGNGGVSKMSVGQQASNNPAPRRTLPVALPKRGQPVIR